MSVNSNLSRVAQPSGVGLAFPPTRTGLVPYRAGFCTGSNGISCKCTRGPGMIEQVSERSVQLQRFKLFDASCCCSINPLVYKTEAQTITHLCRSKTKKHVFIIVFLQLCLLLLLDGKRCSRESYGSFFKNRA